MPYGSSSLKQITEKAQKIYDEYSEIQMIDAHTHFGKDCFWPNIGTADEYIQAAAKKGIGACFAMSTPCPVLSTDEGETILSYYELEGKEIKYYRVEKKKEKMIRIPNLVGVNPYQEANDILYQMVQSRTDFQFEYVPLIHPKYYSEEDIIKHKKRGAKLLKVHGIACGINPLEISSDFFHLLEKYQIPLLIHTDYSLEDNILSKNSAMNWLKVLQNYSIKTYLAHAVRLDDEAIKIVNQDNRYIVGLGPDLLLGKDGQNYVDTKHFLNYCFDHFDENKIVFDIDYPWNIMNKEDYRLDWDSADRVKECLSEEQSQKIFKKNIINFII